MVDLPLLHAGRFDGSFIGGHVESEGSLDPVMWKGLRDPAFVPAAC